MTIEELETVMGSVEGFTLPKRRDGHLVAYSHHLVPFYMRTDEETLSAYHPNTIRVMMRAFYDNVERFRSIAMGISDYVRVHSIELGVGLCRLRTIRFDIIVMEYGSRGKEQVSVSIRGRNEVVPMHKAVQTVLDIIADIDKTAERSFF